LTQLEFASTALEHHVHVQCTQSISVLTQFEKCSEYTSQGQSFLSPNYINSKLKVLNIDFLIAQKQFNILKTQTPSIKRDIYFKFCFTYTWTCTNSPLSRARMCQTWISTFFVS